MTWLDLRTEARSAQVAVPELPELYQPAIATWRGRMINEYQLSAVFGALALQAEQVGLSQAVIAELREFQAEERQHGVLCGAWCNRWAEPRSPR